jgi:rubredoxin
MERHSTSDFACPQCGNASFDSVVTGPTPTDPALASAFARAVADGFVVHEPSADEGDAGHVWRCSSCGHRFGDGEGIPREPWISPDVRANLDLRPASAR